MVVAAIVGLALRLAEAAVGAKLANLRAKHVFRTAVTDACHGMEANWDPELLAVFADAQFRQVVLTPCLTTLLTQAQLPEVGDIVDMCRPYLPEHPGLPDACADFLRRFRDQLTARRELWPYLTMAWQGEVQRLLQEIANQTNRLADAQHHADVARAFEKLHTAAHLHLNAANARVRADRQSAEDLELQIRDNYSAGRLKLRRLEYMSVDALESAFQDLVAARFAGILTALDAGLGDHGPRITKLQEGVEEFDRRLEGAP